MIARILHTTNHFPIINGWVYQDCVVELIDGRTTTASIRSHKLGAL